MGLAIRSGKEGLELGHFVMCVRGNGKGMERKGCSLTQVLETHLNAEFRGIDLLSTLKFNGFKEKMRI